VNNDCSIFQAKVFTRKNLNLESLGEHAGSPQMPLQEVEFGRAHSQKKGHFTFINFAARWECLSFCGPLGMPVILRPAGNACHFAARSEKFILRPAFSECYFADRQECALSLQTSKIT